MPKIPSCLDDHLYTAGISLPVSIGLNGTVANEKE